MKDFLGELYVLFSMPKNIILLVSRVVIAYGFSLPALLKINDLDGTVSWFASISIPFPTFFAYLVSGLESIGIILLILGLFTRFISIMLGFVMIGAIGFVHISNGFLASNGGFEIPLYYLIFLMIFATHGAGKYSLDRLLFEKVNHE
jgi:putative oxidoreductase